MFAIMHALFSFAAALPLSSEYEDDMDM